MGNSTFQGAVSLSWQYLRQKLVHPVELVTKACNERPGEPSLESTALKMAVQTPQVVEAMRRLAAHGWGRRRIAKEHGCSSRARAREGAQGKPADSGACRGAVAA